MQKANKILKVKMKKHKQKKSAADPVAEMTDKNLRTFICIFLIVTTFSIYAQVQNHKFLTYDDAKYVTENPHIQSGFSSESIAWAFTQPYAANWHPVTWLSHMLDYRLYGLEPSGHHLTSLFIHIANSLLLFVILLKMTGALWRSAMVATLFALHPFNVQSVAWVAERKNVLSTFFWFLTMWSYASYAKTPRIGVYLLVILFLALGLMAKPMLVTLPFVLILMDYWPLKRWGWEDTSSQEIKKLILEKTPLFLLVVGASITTYIVQQGGGAVQSTKIFSLSSRTSNALVSYMEYLEKTIWPQGFAVFYPHPGNSLPTWQVLVCGLILVGFSTWVVRKYQQKPYLAVGWFWYLGTLVPVIGIVQVGEQAMADRYMYIPLIGIFIAVVWGISEWIKKGQQKLLFTVAGVCLIPLMIITRDQVKIWQNGVTLFENAADVAKQNHQISSTLHSLLGDAYHQKGKLNLAVSEFKRSLNINPENLSSLSALAVVLEDQGNLKEAEVIYRQAIEQGSKSHLDYYNLGNTLYKMGNFEEAVAYYKKAIVMNPDFVGSYYNLGNALGSQEKFKQAEVSYRQAINLDGKMALPHYGLGIIYQRQGRNAEAIDEFKQALLLNPDLEQAHQFMEKIYNELGQEQLSIFHKRSAEKISAQKK